MTAGSRLRSATLPIDHLEAELRAAPLASPAAFQHALTGLDPELKGATFALWREVEGALLARFPGTSIDELVNRRDAVWFGATSDAPNEVPLGRYLGSLPPISADGGADEQNASRRRQARRWATFAMPPDLLAIGASPRTPPVSAALAHRLAEGGLAETHLHLKAAIDFPVLWASLMRRLAEPSARAEMLASPGAEFDEGRGLASWLLHAALVRPLLAAFLEAANPKRADFAHFLDDRRTALEKTFGALPTGTLFAAVQHLCQPTERDRPLLFGELRAIYAMVTGANARPAARAGDDLRGLDPLSVWYPPGPRGDAESQLLYRGMEYLAQRGTSDRLFAALLWQVTRLRVIFYRHVVQRPMTPGLQWFARTYARLGEPRGPIPLGAFVHTAARMGGPGLRSLEVRITPGQTLQETIASLREIDAACDELRDGGDTMEVGIVVHFSRSRSNDKRGAPQAWGRQLNEDPGFHGGPGSKSNTSGYRFQRYFKQQFKEAMTLVDLFSAFPRALERVRGLDLCTDELGVPIWVLRPLLERVRRAAEAAATSMPGLEPLRMTVHAGEDFVHLLGGLRRMGEAVEFLGLDEDDRLGHGIALGVDVEAWAARTRTLAVPLGERLFDLIWVSRLCAQAPTDTLRSWLPWVESELETRGAELFGAPTAAAELRGFYDALHTSDELAAAGFPDGPVPRGRTHLIRYLTDAQLYRRGQSLVPVNVETEAALVDTVQRQVRAMVSRRGLVVELNPSSNLLIGHFGDLNHHPMWRICDPRGLEPSQSSVRVCVGSDDPITFAATLPEEFQLLADALLEGGLGVDEIDRWLDLVRVRGLTGRFTVPRSRHSLWTHGGPI